MAPAPAASSISTVPIPSDRDRAEPVGTPFLRLPPPNDVPPVTTTDLDALRAQLPNLSSVIPQRAIHTPTGLENNRSSPRATPPCTTWPLAGREICPPMFCRVSLPTSALPFRMFKSCAQRPLAHHRRGHRSTRPTAVLPPLRRARNARWVVRHVY